MMEISDLEEVQQYKVAAAIELLRSARKGLRHDAKDCGISLEDSGMDSSLKCAIDWIEDYDGILSPFDNETELEVYQLGEILERDASPQDTMFSTLGEDTYNALKSLWRKLKNGEIVLMEEV